MRQLITALLFCVMSSVAASAQYSVVDTFRFRVMEKTPEHPFYGMGDEIGFSVNGVEGGTIYMIRDSVYIFTHENMRPDEAPTLALSGRGRGSDHYPKGYFDDDHENRIRYFRLPSDAPDTLYYVDSDNRWAGGMIVVVDSLVSGVAGSQVEAGWPELHRSIVSPNPLVSTGTLSFNMSQGTTLQVEVVDVLGRNRQSYSMSLSAPDSVDIPISRKGLPAGIYFYRVMRDDGELLTTGSFHVR